MSYTGNEAMEKEPMGRLLLRLAVPSITAQMVNLLYNMIDRVFVGRMEGGGFTALAGLGMVLPIISIINAFANLVGMGGAPLAAIQMGKKNREKAERILGNCTVLLLGLAVLLTSIILVWKEDILRFFGADETTMSYASNYLPMYALGNVFTMGALGLNPFITTQGYNKISMCNICVGAVINIILDPIFIYGFDFGIAGAAIATVISQGCSFLLVILFLLGKKTDIHFRRFTPEGKILMEVISLGFASFFMGVTESLVQSVYNKQLLRFGGSKYVAVMSIVFSISQIIYVPVVGLGQGGQPIISYNYGAQNTKRLKEIFHILRKYATVYSVIISFLIELFPMFICKMFTADVGLIAISVPCLRIFVSGRFMNGIQFAGQSIFQAVGDGKAAMYVAAFRKVILIIPLAFILPSLMGLGVNGVFWAEAISDLLAALNAGLIFKIRRKKIYNYEI